MLLLYIPWAEKPEIIKLYFKEKHAHLTCNIDFVKVYAKCCKNLKIVIYTISGLLGLDLQASIKMADSS